MKRARDWALWLGLVAGLLAVCWVAVPAYPQVGEVEPKPTATPRPTATPQPTLTPTPVPAITLRPGEGCELLVYKGPHWMDRLSTEILAKRLESENFAAKYAARNRPGDVIQVYPAGRCREKPAPGSGFVIVKCSDVSFEDAKAALEEARVDGDGKLLAKRRYQVNTGALLVVERETFVSRATLLLVLEDKARAVEVVP